jgi:hypothetical protein
MSLFPVPDISSEYRILSAKSSFVGATIKVSRLTGLIFPLGSLCVRPCFLAATIEALERTGLTVASVIMFEKSVALMLLL